ncbi:MAG: glycosyltransferase family 2 protein [Kiritimatiellia bacterium]
MTASIIIPCWNSEATLERCLACVRAQTLEGFEAIFIDDGSTDGTGAKLAAAARRDPRIRVLTQPNRGVSAARNAGLDAARGEFIFFADPDDAFSAEMLAKGVAAMEAAGADYCVFPYRERSADEAEFHLVPLKGTCRYASNAEIVSRHLSRLFGYSAEQVRAWYAGEPLYRHRLQGGVWRCVYRRALIEAHGVRFDERIALYEDAMFNCEYMLHAARMTCVEEPLYDYILLRTGAVARLRRGRRELANKLELLRKRKELDAKSGGRLGPMYACSCVFSLLEMLALVFTRRAPFGEGLRLVNAYGRDAVVRAAVRDFPLSWRRPVLALAVRVLRVWFG